MPLVDEASEQTEVVHRRKQCGHQTQQWVASSNCLEASAKHGHRWWEIDVTYWLIRLFGVLGLARQIAMPRRRLGGSRLAPIVTRLPDDPGEA